MNVIQPCSTASVMKSWCFYECRIITLTKVTLNLWSVKVIFKYFAITTHHCCCYVYIILRKEQLTLPSISALQVAPITVRISFTTFETIQTDDMTWHTSVESRWYLSCTSSSLTYNCFSSLSLFNCTHSEIHQMGLNIKLLSMVVL